MDFLGETSLQVLIGSYMTPGFVVAALLATLRVLRRIDKIAGEVERMAGEVERIAGNQARTMKELGLEER